MSSLSVGCMDLPDRLVQNHSGLLQLWDVFPLDTSYFLTSPHEEGPSQATPGSEAQEIGPPQ